LQGSAKGSEVSKFRSFGFPESEKTSAPSKRKLADPQIGAACPKLGGRARSLRIAGKVNHGMVGT
jgi:hypothetical protein